MERAIMRRPTPLTPVLALVLVILAGVAPAQSQAALPPQTDKQKIEAPSYQVSLATSPVKIDGVLDEGAWSNAAVIPLPFEWSPKDNSPAPVKTECLVTYDLHNLYIAFRCFDCKPRKIRAHLMDRDDSDKLILDDHVNFMIDAFNDKRRSFEFWVNPLGAQADANFSESESESYEDFSWDAIWDAAGKITDWGYAIEVAIPLNQLRFKKTGGPQTWGFGAERSWPRDDRHRMTSYVRSRDKAGVIGQLNKLTGFEGITPNRNIELNPTLTGTRTDEIPAGGFPDEPLENGKAKVDPGLTAEWGITPNLVFNAAANPDFSQVEADAAQLQVNRRFVLFYPEKRPFFCEGADLFKTPVTAVFTRTVADPLWGTKVTGKFSGTAIGVFAAQDEVTNLLFPSNQGSSLGALETRDGADVNSYGGVVRVRQDVPPAGSTVGILYTGRTGPDYYNHVGGVDGFLRFNDNDSLTFQYLHSETDYPPQTAATFGQSDSRFGGNAFHVRYDYWSRDLVVNAIYTDLSAGFRADYGFVERVDTRDFMSQVFRKIYGKPGIDGKPGDWFNLIQLGVRGEVIYDHKGTLTDRTLTLALLSNGKLETRVDVYGVFSRTYYGGEYFDTALGQVTSRIQPFSGSEFGLEAWAGEAVDYTNVRLAHILHLGPNFTLFLGRHFNITASDAYERLYLGRQTIYTVNLVQSRFIYCFSTRALVRAIVQYQDLRQNPDMYAAPVDPREEKVLTQLLFSYKLNSRTVFFVGYSDNSLGGELDASGFGRVAITRTDRTFFIKISYALQI